MSYLLCWTTGSRDCTPLFLLTWVRDVIIVCSYSVALNYACPWHTHAQMGMISFDRTHTLWPRRIERYTCKVWIYRGKHWSNTAVQQNESSHTYCVQSYTTCSVGVELHVQVNNSYANRLRVGKQLRKCTHHAAVDLENFSRGGNSDVL